MNLPRHSITTKLLLIILFVGIISVLIVGSYSFYSARRAIIHRTVEQLTLVRAVKKQQVEFLFSVKSQNLLNLSSLSNPGQEVYRSYGFSNLYPVYADRQTGERKESLLHQIEKLMSGLDSVHSTAISDLFLKSPEDTIPVFLVGCLVGNTRPGSPIAYIGEVSSTEINSIMLNDNFRSGLGHSGEAYLVGADGMMRSTSRFIQRSILKVPVRSATALEAIAGGSGYAVTDDYRGVPVISAYAPLELPGLNWVVMAEIDYEEAMIPVTALRNDILIVSLVIIFLILGFARLISKMVTEPIIRLKNAAAGLGRGNFNRKVTIRSGDEIGLLAETFNAMSEQLSEERRHRLTALFDGQEMERRRISRELHDGLGQKLVGTKLQIENCDDADLRCLQRTMADAKSQLHGIVEELHRISNDLRPVALNELGLAPALQDLCRDVSLQSGLEVEFDSNGVSVQEDKTADYLYRICQETLLNTIKHAHATRVSVQLLETRDALVLIVEDNGRGFDVSDYPGGNGLSNISDRAALLGGTMSIESEEGAGVTIRVKIPKSP